MVVIIKKEIIILPNENLYNIQNYYQSFDISINHCFKYKEFAILNGIKFSAEYKSETGFNWGKTLAQQDFFNIEIETKNLICFIPVNISKNQYKWLKKNKNKIFNYNICYVSFYENEIKKSDYISNPDVFLELYDEIKEKYDLTKEKSNGKKY